LTLISVKVLVKSAVSDGSEAPYRPRFRLQQRIQSVGVRILVIEDERTLAGFIGQSLHADGYAVTVCHDGPRREAAALTGDYALVLLDLTLPGKDGLEILAAIRTQMPELPVIVPDGESRDRAAGRGARSWRERLRDQAVLPGGAARSGPRAAALAHAA
jgi:CheY-like chemotaxis protein